MPQRSCVVGLVRQSAPPKPLPILDPGRDCGMPYAEPESGPLLPLDAVVDHPDSLFHSASRGGHWSAPQPNIASIARPMARFAAFPPPPPPPPEGRAGSILATSTPLKFASRPTPRPDGSGMSMPIGPPPPSACNDLRKAKIAACPPAALTSSAVSMCSPLD